MAHLKIRQGSGLLASYLSDKTDMYQNKLVTLMS